MSLFNANLSGFTFELNTREQVITCHSLSQCERLWSRCYFQDATCTSCIFQDVFNRKRMAIHVSAIPKGQTSNVSHELVTLNDLINYLLKKNVASRMCFSLELSNPLNANILHLLQSNGLNFVGYDALFCHLIISFRLRHCTLLSRLPKNVFCFTSSDIKNHACSQEN